MVYSAGGNRWAHRRIVFDQHTTIVEASLPHPARMPNRVWNSAEVPTHADEVV
jgi:hypothetical protein